jgi:hypothetical protein
MKGLRPFKLPLAAGILVVEWGMQKEWWNTPMAAWAFTAIGIGGGTVLTFVSPYIGLPIVPVYRKSQ